MTFETVPSGCSWATSAPGAPVSYRGDAIIRTTARSGTPDAVDSIHIRYASGGTSTIAFRTYEGGRESFQAATCHVVWMDEEPPHSIYVEALMRTATVGGVLLATFTPLRGLSATALHFLPAGRAPENPQAGPYVTFIEWSDVPHLSDETKTELLQSISSVNARRADKGAPQLGSGALYPIPEEDVVSDPFEFPAWYRHVYGMDVGWNRTAAVWGALDPSSICSSTRNTIAARPSRRSTRRRSGRAASGSLG